MDIGSTQQKKDHYNKILLSLKTSDKDFWSSKNMMDKELVTFIIDQPLKTWKHGEIHPLILCSCKNGMACQMNEYNNKISQRWICRRKSVSNFGNATTNASIGNDNNKRGGYIPKPCKTLFYSNQAFDIIFKIGHIVSRVPVLRGFFSPMQVRFASHIGYPLINHTPPLASTSSWTSKSFEIPFLLQTPSEKNDTSSGDFATKVGNSNGKSDNEMIDFTQIRKWCDFDEPLPTPTVFVGFGPSSYSQLCIRRLYTTLINNGFTSKTYRVLGSINCYSSPEEISEYKELIDSIAMTSDSKSIEKTFIIEMSTYFNAMSEYYDYILRLGFNTTKIKIVAPWKVTEKYGLKSLFIPLHGMGKDDLDWLYGNHEMIIFFNEKNDKITCVKSMHFKHVVLSIYNDVLSKQSGSVINVKDLFIPFSKGNFVKHNDIPLQAEERDGGCHNNNDSLMINSSSLKPTSEVKNEGNINHTSTEQVTLNQLYSQVFQTYDGSIVEKSYFNDEEKHEVMLRYSKCGPNCFDKSSNTQESQSLKVHHDIHSQNSEIIISSDIKEHHHFKEEEDEKMDTTLNCLDNGIVVSLSNGLAYDKYLVISVERMEEEINRRGFEYIFKVN